MFYVNFDLKFINSYFIKLQIIRLQIKNNKIKTNDKNVSEILLKDFFRFSMVTL